VLVVDVGAVGRAGVFDGDAAVRIDVHGRVTRGDRGVGERDVETVARVRAADDVTAAAE